MSKMMEIKTPKINTAKVICNLDGKIKEYDISTEELYKTFEPDSPVVALSYNDMVKDAIEQSHQQPFFPKAMAVEFDMKGDKIRTHNIKLYSDPFGSSDTIGYMNGQYFPLDNACIVGDLRGPFGMFIPFSASPETLMDCSLFLNDCARTNRTILDFFTDK